MNKWQLKPGTVKDIHRQASSFLREIGKNPREAQWLLQNFYHWTLTDFYRFQERQVPQADCLQIESQVNQLAEGIPFQYVVGEVSFLGHTFRVTPDVLIPRPETEEWVKKALEQLGEAHKPLKVLDIGTGSGVIAVSHALSRPMDKILATDISAEALRMARLNARALGAEIEFQKSDLFETIGHDYFHIIYANPPYIAISEIDEMGENVLKYEPHVALFGGEEGLTFYRRLAEKIEKYVNPSNYHIFLEIGYRQRQAVMKLLHGALPTSQIECWTDFNGLDRVIHIWRKDEMKGK